MTSFRDQLLSAEEDFLSALVEGGDAILAFERRWESLFEDVSLAVEAGSLNDEISTLAHTIALRIAMLADTSADVFSSCDSFTSHLMDQMETLVSELSLADHTHYVPTTPPSPRPRTPLPSDTECRKGRKRCRSSPDYAQGKRRRTGTEDIPSPSVHVVRNPTQEEIPSSVSKKRKRCASDADASPTHPHAKRLHVGPRLYAVSDSFRMALSSSSEPVGTSLAPLPRARPMHFDPSLPVDIYPMIEASEWRESFTLSAPTTTHDCDLGYASSNLLTDLPQISDLDAFFSSWQPSVATSLSQRTGSDYTGEIDVRELSPPDLSHSGPSTPANSPTPNHTPSPSSLILPPLPLSIVDNPSPPYRWRHWHDEELELRPATEDLDQMSGPCDPDASSDNTLKTFFTGAKTMSHPAFVESTTQPSADLDSLLDPSVLFWALARPCCPSTPGAPVSKGWSVLPFDGGSLLGEIPNTLSVDESLLSLCPTSSSVVGLQR